MIGGIGDDVARELRRFGVAPGLAAIVEAWPAAVGDAVARNAWPARLGRDGTLHVNAASSAWAFELAHLEGRIRESLGALAPARLRFAVGSLPEPAATVGSPPRPAPVEPGEEHLAEARELAAGIGDESLRKIVAKTAALSLASAAADRSLW